MLVPTIYSRSVNFDTANDGVGDVGRFRVVKFLDLWCYMARGKQYFSLVHKNDLFAFSGIVSLKTRTDTPYPTEAGKPSPKG